LSLSSFIILPSYLLSFFADSFGDPHGEQGHTAIKKLREIRVVGGMVGISTRAAWRREIGETMWKLEFGKQSDENIYNEKIGI
jgi:hypothetical protein